MLAIESIQESFNSPLKNKDVIVFGSLNMDLVAEASDVPRENKTVNSPRFNTQPGGRGGNEAVSISRLGTPVSLISRVGDDDFGKILIDHIRQEGIICDDFIGKDTYNPTGVAMIIQVKGERSSKNICKVTCKGSNDNFGKEEIQTLQKILSADSVLVINLEINCDAVISAVNLGYKKNATIFLKASPLDNVKIDDLEYNILPFVDTLFVNEFEAPGLLRWSDKTPLLTVGEAAMAAEEIQRRFKIRCVIVNTLTGAFLRCLNEKGEVKNFLIMPTVIVEKNDIVDIVGAADALVGGYVAAVVSGKSDFEGLTEGMCCAAFSTRGPGAQSSLPDRSKLDEFLSGAKKNSLPDEVKRKKYWDPFRPYIENLTTAILIGRGREWLKNWMSDVETQDYHSKIEFLRKYTNMQGFTWLHIAVFAADIKCAAFLIAKGSDCLMRDLYGLSALERTHHTIAVTANSYFDLRKDAMDSKHLMLLKRLLLGSAAIDRLHNPKAPNTILTEMQTGIFKDLPVFYPVKVLFNFILHDSPLFKEVACYHLHIILRGQNIEKYKDAIVNIMNFRDSNGLSFLVLSIKMDMPGISVLLVRAYESIVDSETKLQEDFQIAVDVASQNTNNKNLNSIIEIFDERNIKPNIDRVQNKATSPNSPVPFSLTHFSSPRSSSLGSNVSENSCLNSEPEEGKDTVLVFGSINADLMAQIDTFENSSSPGKNFQIAPGGKGANEAVAIRKLGVYVRLVGRIASDEFGRSMKETLEAANINTEGVVMDDSGQCSTGVAVVLTADTKKKLTVPVKGANGMVSEKDTERVVRYFREEKPKYLLMQMEIDVEQMIRAAKQARDMGIKVILKTSPLANREDIPEPLMKCVTILIANEYEAPILLGWQKKDGKNHLTTLDHAREAALELQERHGVETVLVNTMQGLVHVTRDERENIDIFCQPKINKKPVDVIGAADAATGGYVAALAIGKSSRHASIWFSACGTKSTQGRGGQSSLPNREDLEDFLKEKKINMGKFLPYKTQNPECKWLFDCLLRTPHSLEAQLENHIEMFEGSSQENSAKFLNRCRDFSGQTALHVAVLFCNIDLVIMLLYKGADPLVKDYYHYSPIDRAHECQFAFGCSESWDQYRMIKDIMISLVVLRAKKKPHLHIEFNFPLNDLKIKGRNVDDHLAILHDALFESSIKNKYYRGLFESLAIELYDNEPEMFDWTDDKTGQTMIHAAAFSGSHKLLKIWIALADKYDRKKELLSAMDNFEHSCIHFAARSRNLETCKILLGEGKDHIDPLAPSKAGETAIDQCPDEEFRKKLTATFQLKEVFISYKHTEGVEIFAGKLQKALKYNGVDAWLDKEDLHGGDAWKQKLTNALRSCVSVIIILSKSYFGAPWCKGEFQLAKGLNKRFYCVIPNGLPENDAISLKDLTTCIPEEMQTELLHNQATDFSVLKCDESSILESSQIKDLSRTLLLKAARDSKGLIGIEEVKLQISGDTKEFILIAAPQLENNVNLGYSNQNYVIKFALTLASFIRHRSSTYKSTCFAGPLHEFNDVKELLKSENCKLCIVVLADSDTSAQEKWTTDVLQSATEAEKKILIAPISDLSTKKDKERGASYILNVSLSSDQTYQFCFVDPFGSPETFFSEKNELAKRLCRDFVCYVDKVFEDGRDSRGDF